MKTQTRYPQSRRNNYYACLLHLQQGETATAIGHCEAALRARERWSEVAHGFRSGSRHESERSKGWPHSPTRYRP